MSKNDLLNNTELGELKHWLDENKDQLPEVIIHHLKRLLRVYLSLSKKSDQAKKTLQLLREAMGITPKSEKGRSEAPTEQLELLSDEQKQQLMDFKKKSAELAKERAEYLRKIRRLTPKEKVPEQLELAPAEELMFSTPTGYRKNEGMKNKVERMKEFNKEVGLHSTFETVKRVNLEVVITDIQCEVETVTDFTTGKSVRASMKDFGPEGFQLTWRAIANLVKMHVGFAIPINRLELMIGQPEFTSGKICRIFEFMATELLPIYLHLPSELASTDNLSGDDTPTKIIAVNEGHKSEESLAAKIDEDLGWSVPRADGKGDKKTLNVSLLIGKTVKKDPRSTIRFFRTHLGSVGNLLTKVLEWRKPKAGPIIFQGDLSTTNLPNPKLREKFEFQVAGCGAHARRPFWRFRANDEGLCYWMLQGFWLLSFIEKVIDSHGRTEETVLHYRNRYARKVWQALYNRCVAATTGTSPGRFTYRKGTFPQAWPPDSDIYKACMYVINHFTKLTVYLDNAALHYTNNISERGLRIEKCMLSSSKFRWSRKGRAILDILRTINATCTAAKIEIETYFKYVHNHKDELHDYPERFTPYAVALALEDKSQPPA